MKSAIENGVLLQVHPDDIINGHFDGGTEITHVAKEAFINRIDLISVALPEVRQIGAFAFCGCENLAGIDFPKAKIIGSCSFLNCHNLNTIILLQAEEIGESAFDSCSKLTNAILPKVKIIGGSAFIFTQVKVITLPEVKEIRDRGFFGCNNLIIATLSKASVIDEKAFTKCKNLKYLIINTDQLRDVEEIRKQLPENLRDKTIIFNLELMLKKYWFFKQVLNQNNSHMVLQQVLSHANQLGVFFDYEPEPSVSKMPYKLNCRFFKSNNCHRALKHNACENEQLYSKALNSGYNRYESYEQYVYTVNALNAYLEGNQIDFISNMTKLGKDYTFKIIVSFIGVPYNPFALGYLDALGGREEKTLYEIMNDYEKTSTRDECFALLEEQFSPGRLAYK